MIYRIQHKRTTLLPWRNLFPAYGDERFPHDNRGYLFMEKEEAQKALNVLWEENPGRALRIFEVNELQEVQVIIHSPGDPSVGLWSETWRITGPFYFEGLQEKEHFREKIWEAFEYLADDHKVIFGSEDEPEPVQGE